MNKGTLAILIIVLVLGGSWAAGYRVHPKNLSYYFKKDSSGQKSEVIFKNGTTLTGTVSEEGGDKIRINVDGAGVVFSKSEIASINSGKSENFLETLRKNYKSQQKLHPLITHSKESSFQGKFDSFIGESDRISEEIRKKNPQITSDGAMQAVMEQVRSAQVLAKARNDAAIAEMEQSY